MIKCKDALAAEAVKNYEVAAWNWQRAIDMQSAQSYRERWFLHYRLATNLREVGKIPQALSEINALLAMNPRQISVLVLKTKCHLDLFQGDEARTALEQLQWSISKSDPDFPARLEAAQLEARLSALAGTP